MLFFLLSSALLFNFSESFSGLMNRNSLCNKRVSVQMIVARDLPGKTAPIGFFDPFGFSDRASPKSVKLWREAELKHGRVAMLSVVGFLVAERWNPLFGGKISGPAIYHFQQIENVYYPFWIFLLGSIAVIEGYSVARGWESQEEKTENFAMLKDDYVPGDLGFDPLSLRPYGGTNYNNLSPNFVKICNKELNNGRLAMIAIAGMVAQELVDKNTIMGHLAEHGFAAAKYGASTNALGAF